MADGRAYIYGFIVGFFCWIVGCNENTEPETTDRIRQQLVVKAAPENRVDSARLFFFRVNGDTDTLILQKSMGGVEYLKPKDFYFTLPAGKYKTYILANVSDRNIVITSPYSSELLSIYYPGGEQPGAVYYGFIPVNVGVDTLNMSSLILLSAAIELSILKVPATVQKIIVTLWNTSAGYSFSGGYNPEVTDPPIADTLNDVRQDSTYQVMLTCFPGSGLQDKSTLQVDCYNAAQSLVYSGRSAPFLARYGQNMVISCSFGNLTKAFHQTGQGIGKIYFEGNKE